jgi:hypothetical protein
MSFDHSPPPQPAAKPLVAGLALPALLLGILALVLALPILWWRISTQPAAISLSGEIVREVAQVVQGADLSTALPSWYAGVRAFAIIAAFLALLLAIIALILKHSGRMAGIAVVLALAAFAATSSSLMLMIVGGALLLGVLLLMLGVG